MVNIKGMVVSGAHGAANGTMIHCGDPIQYDAIDTSYWQSHFLQFGRLP